MEIVKSKELMDILKEVHGVNSYRELLPLIKKELRILDDNSDEEIMAVLERAYDIGYDDGFESCQDFHDL